MRGCFGGCTFCSITEHEGRVIQSRSRGERAARDPRAAPHGRLPRHDHRPRRPDREHVQDARARAEEIESEVPPALLRAPGRLREPRDRSRPAHRPDAAGARGGGRQARLHRLGVRYDLAERSPEYVEELAAHHVGGQLSVAPEHVEPARAREDEEAGHRELRALRRACSRCASEDAGKEQYDIPYFITGHPGSTLEDMIELALWLKQNGKRPRQVQDFIPTPMSMADLHVLHGHRPAHDASRSTRPRACARRSCRRRCCSTGTPSSGRSRARRSARPAAPT